MIKKEIMETVKLFLEEGNLSLIAYCNKKYKPIDLSKANNEELEKEITSSIQEIYKKQYYKSEENSLPIEYTGQSVNIDECFYIEKTECIDLIDNLCVGHFSETVKKDEIPDIELLIFKYVDSGKTIYIIQDAKTKIRLKNKGIWGWMDNQKLKLFKGSILCINQAIDLIINDNIIIFKKPESLQLIMDFDTQNDVIIQNNYRIIEERFTKISRAEEYIKLLPKKYKNRLRHVNEYDIINKNKTDLINIIKNDPQLKKKISIENDDFCVNNLNDFKAYVSIFTDDLLSSKFTDNMYITIDKEKR